MLAALRLGSVYFAVVFAAGFVLGVARTLWIAPQVGELAAVALESPVMIAVSAAACFAVLGRAPAGFSASQAWAMGGFAFALLIAAEMVLATAWMGTAPQDLLSAYARPEAMLGLAGQVVFALLPRLSLRFRRPAPR